MRHVTTTSRSALWGHKKVRFAAVGTVNSIVDFSILFTLSIIAGIPVFIANIISTSCALTVSYLLNKNAVFGRAGGSTSRTVTLFLVVTLSGLWLLQPLVIFLVDQAVSMFVANTLPVGIVLLIGKVCATLVTLIWNYLWYSRLVFRKEEK